MLGRRNRGVGPEEVELVFQECTQPHRLELLGNLLQLRAQGLKLLRRASDLGHALLDALHFQEIPLKGPVRGPREIGVEEVAQPAVLPVGAEEVSEPVQALFRARGGGRAARTRE